MKIFRYPYAKDATEEAFAENVYDDLYYGYMWGWIRQHDSIVLSGRIDLDRAKEIYDWVLDYSQGDEWEKPYECRPKYYDGIDTPLDASVWLELSESLRDGLDTGDITADDELALRVYMAGDKDNRVTDFVDYTLNEVLARIDGICHENCYTYASIS